MASSKLVFKDPIPMRDRVNGTLPRPAVIEIKRSMSKPAVPNAPSILTTFPPEIRNAIYTILFKRDAPIKIVDYEIQRQGPPWLLDYASQYDYGHHDSEPEAKAEFNAVQLEATDLMSLRTHDIYQATAMLRACRQSYHEAVGILYGHNTFLFTTPAHQHNWKWSQVANAVQFLQSVGSQRGLITHIAIDVGRVCPLSCRDGHPTDWLPLINFMWSRPNNSPQISFVDTGREFCEKLHDPSDYRENEKLPAPKMNNILNAIVREDALSIRRYGRFTRLLECIWVQRWYSGHPDTCTVLVNGLYESGFRIFQINETGRMLDQIDNDRNATLDKIAHPIFARIMDHAITSDETTVFNLDSQSVKNYDNSMSSLCCRSRDYFQLHYTKLRKTVLMLETQTTSTSFNGFARLQDWKQGPYEWMLRNRGWNCAAGRFDPTIAFRFNTIPIDPSELRIEIFPFLKITLNFNRRTTLRFSTPSIDNSISIIEHELQLESLRRRCFLLVSEILIESPGRAHEEVPEIWIDGTGALVEATSRKVTILRPKLRVKPSLGLPSEPRDVLACGQLHKTKLIQTMEAELRKIEIRPYLQRNLAEAGPWSMLAFWETLHIIDW